jgi:hypothetical protein
MYDDIRDFLTTRLSVLDPTLSTSPGARMHTVVIDPMIRRMGTDARVVDIAAFVTERIRETFPEIDVTAGSNFTDLFVNPLMALLEPYRIEIGRMTAANATDDPEALSDDEVDRKLSNLFVTRDQGNYGVGYARVFFDTPRSVGFDQSTVFSTARGLQYVPDIAVLVREEDLRRSGALYYIDIEVRSLEPTSVSVAPGLLTSVSGVEGVVKVTNISQLRAGSERESNADFLDRAVRMVSERSPTTVRGIEALILPYFSTVEVVRAVGFGEPEMTRDILSVELPSADAGVGDLLMTTSRFRSDRVVSLDAGAEFPFTNRLVVRDITADQQATILNARYVRVVDGNGHYADAEFGRLRRVTRAVANGTDVVLVLADFTVYPAPASDLAASSGGTIDTAAGGVSYNPSPARGTYWSMLTDYSGTTYLRGAPLPFTDTANYAGLPGLPATAAQGRDFLVLASAGIQARAGFDIHDSVSMHPIAALSPTDNYLRVARRSAFMSDQERTGVVGSLYEYPETDDSLSFHLGVDVKGFGSPAYGESAAVTRYDGVTKSDWTRNAGATLQLKDPTSWVVWSGGLGTDSNRAEISLEPTTPSWQSRGASIGDYISVAVSVDDDVTGVGGAYFDGTLAQEPASVLWHAWGRIVEIPSDHTLRVEGLATYPLDTMSASETAAFDWPSGTFDPTHGGVYRLLWTLYGGTRAQVSPDGAEFVSYDNFEFLPAYAKAGAAGDIEPPWRSTYKDDGLYSDVLSTENTAIDQSAPSHRAFVVRLEEHFAEELRADSAVGRAWAATLVDLDMSLTHKTDLLKLLYPTWADREVQSGVVRPTVYAPTLLPAVGGQTQVAADGSSVGWAAPEPNPAALSGRLLPHPCGPHTLIDEPTWAAALGTSLYNQVLQVYGASDASVDTGTELTVTGMPGSVPFPEQYGAGMQFNANEVHMGGLVDVYLSASDYPVTGVSYVSSPENTAWGDIVAEGGDGRVDPAASDSSFFSPALASYLAGVHALSSGEYKYVGALPDGSSLSVIILEPPSVLSITSFRPLNNVAGGVKIAGTFDGLSGPVVGLRWQLVRSATTGVAEPKVLVQHGENMITTAGTYTVRVPTGIVFTADPSSYVVYMEITEGAAKGVYRVSAKGAFTLTLTEPILASVAAAAYRVFFVQDSEVYTGVATRLRSLEVATTDGTLPVPYRHPLEVAPPVVSSFNDDPVTDDLVGQNATLACDAVGPATLTVTAGGFDWAVEGVRVNDAVRLDLQDAGLRHFYVASLTASTLTLDRVVGSTNVSGVGFTVGRPALATAKVYFKDRTYLYVDQTTVLTADSADGASRTFRPSQDEEAEIFSSADSTPSCVSELEGALVGARLAFDFNLFAAGIRAGDELVVVSTDILTEVNVSPAFSITGQRLVFSVDDAQFAVTFQDVGVVGFDEVASAINAQLGAYMLADVDADRLRIHSAQHVYVADAGTPGILDTLGFNGSLAITNNKPGLSTYFKTYTVASLDYDSVTDTSYIVLPERTWGNGARYSVEVNRAAAQVVYPDQMIADGAFFYANVKIVSQDPQDGNLGGFEAMTIAGYTTLGYDYVQAEDSYALSVLEDFAVSVTPTLLLPGARSLQPAIVLSDSTLSAQVETCAEVGDVQEFLLREDTRAICHNVLVKHFAPAYPAVTLKVAGTASLDAIRLATAEYMKTVYPSRVFEVFDLLRALANIGVTYATLPMRAGFLIMGRDRRLSLFRTESRLLLDSGTHVTVADMSMVTIEAAE